MAVFDGLGTALRLLRVERGLTQVQVAQRCGIGKSLISRYEAEITEPKLASLSRLLECLESDLAELEEALRRVRRHREGSEKGRAPGPRGDRRQIGTTSQPEPSAPTRREPRRAFVVFEVPDQLPAGPESTDREPEFETLQTFRSMMRYLLRETPRTQRGSPRSEGGGEAREMNG